MKGLQLIPFGIYAELVFLFINGLKMIKYHNEKSDLLNISREEDIWNVKNEFAGDDFLIFNRIILVLVPPVYLCVVKNVNVILT